MLGVYNSPAAVPLVGPGVAVVVCITELNMRIISGSQRGRKLLGPRDSSVRPALDSVREAVFNILSSEVEGARVLDLFCGIGAFGLEALSRGARKAHFVDNSSDSLAILRRNIELLGFDAFVSVEQGNAYGFHDSADAVYDLIFADPPFRVFKQEGGAERVFSMAERLLCPEPGREKRTMVLRLPSWYRQEPPFRVDDRRVYGESVVLFLSTPGDASGSS